MSIPVSEVQSVKVQRRVRAPLSQGVVEGIVGILDVIAIVLSGIVLLHVFSPRLHDMRAEFGVIAIYTGMVVLGLHAVGAYGFRVIMRPWSHAMSVVVVCVGIFMGLSLLAFALKMSAEFSRLWSFSWLLTAIVCVLTFRLLAALMLRHAAENGRIGRRIVIFGAGAQGQRIIERIEQLNEPWNRIVGVFDDRLSRITVCGEKYPVLGNLDDLIAWGRRNHPDEVLVALPWGAESRLVQVLQSLAVLPANVRLCSEFTRMDLIHGRANSQFGLPTLSAFEKPVEGWGRIWKRLFDLVLSTVAILVCLPVLCLIALAIRLESPGPILFRQQRFGFNNKLIEVYKFRTMRADASDALGERLTARGDPRVTRVGAILRRFSLDELPQLLNVLRGEMSVVGPRPHAIRTTAGDRQCDEVVDQYAIRHKVKPGITGWAQVNGWRGTMENEEHLIRRVEHDLHYINNWSPLFDLRIIVQTIWIVITGRNSF